MSKINAVIDLSREFGNTEPTPASFKRSIKSAKTLGFTKDETLRLLSCLEFCDTQGNGFKPPFVELMQQFMAKPDATEPNETKLIVNNIDDNAEIRAINKRNVTTLLKALRDRQKISAIKEIRAMLGIGLKEAKDICEANFF